MQSQRVSWRSGGALIGALALVVFCSGCLQSTTEVDQGATTDASLPTISTIRESVSMTDAQAAELAPMVERWHAAERSSSDQPAVSPVMEFLAASADVLDRAQVRGVIRVMREHASRRISDGEFPRRGRRFGRHGPPGPHGGFGDHGPFAELGLSEEQKEALRDARLKMRETMRDLREQRDSGALSDEEFRQAVSEARDAHQVAVRDILTPEQYAQLQEFRKERLVERLKRQIERHARGSERRLELLTKILELEPAQVEAIAAIQAGVQPQLEAILAGLLDGSVSIEDARTALHELRKTTHAAVVAELSDEQAALLEELLTLRHRRGPRGHRGPRP